MSVSVNKIKLLFAPPAQRRSQSILVMSSDVVQHERTSLLRLLKPPEPSLPSHSFSGSRDNTIKIKHPGYPDDYEQNVLMMLYAFDCQGGGLHCGTALIACALVAGNAWNGYFTLEHDGGHESHWRMTMSCWKRATTSTSLLPRRARMTTPSTRPSSIDLFLTTTSLPPGWIVLRKLAKTATMLPLPLPLPPTSHPPSFAVMAVTA